MQIGELARRFQVTVESVRYYEREGLMPKARRTSGNYRVYDEACARQLSFVLNCRSLGLSQCEIRQLLTVRAAPARDCGNVNAPIDGHIEQVSQGYGISSSFDSHAARRELLKIAKSSVHSPDRHASRRVVKDPSGECASSAGLQSVSLGCQSHSCLS